MNVESRSLRYFVAACQERNFTRAAHRLKITPPVLSRSIRKLEQELGVQLFHRTTRAVEITDAGASFLVDVTRALEALDAAVARATRAKERSIILAVKADADGGILDTLLEATAREQGAEPVAVRLCRWGEHGDLLRRGEVDAALVYAPFDQRALDFEVVRREPRVAALPSSHELAGRAGVTMEDIGLRVEDMDTQTERDVSVHGAEDLAQLLALVGLGAATTVLSASTAERYPRPGVRYIPIVDAPPTVLSIAWHEDSTSRGIAAIVRAATALPQSNWPASTP